ncbi:hypothetical protein [Vitreimonas sp.]|uniref:hypothetical protein n=1 Tax=Vitreimonas sp. TaxID=3069702 RepID=UPI002EDB88B2
MAESRADQVVELAGVERLLAGLFSWVVLASVSIIISGKLVAARIKLGLKRNNDLFSIPTPFFQLHAKNEEVTLGLLFFVFSLGLVVSFGGRSAYEFFRQNAGLDIGQWNSLCAIASFLSVVTASACWVLGAFVRSAPIIRNQERDEQIANLKKRVDEHGGE